MACDAKSLIAQAVALHYDGLCHRTLVGLLPTFFTGAVPLSPTTLAVTQTTSSSITLSWAQPSNSPADVISGYVVRWGTSSGGYTAQSNIPPSPLAYTITGLSPSTTYYITVQAVSAGGCVSALSAQLVSSTSGGGGSSSPFADAWATRVVANGGAAPSQPTKDAIAAFQNGLVTDGLDTLMISWNAVVPDSLIAARTPQLVGSGNNPWQDTTTPFLNADLSVNGLLGNSGKGLDTGLIPSVIYPNENSAGLTYYMTSNGGPSTLACFDVNGAVFAQLPNYTGFGFFFCCYGNNGACPDRINNAGFGNFNGYVSGNRTALNAMSAYQANSSTAHAVIGSCAGNTTGTRPATSIWAIVDKSTGTAYPGTFSFFAVHLGLTQAQSALFYARIQTLRQTLGGGFQ